MTVQRRVVGVDQYNWATEVPGMKRRQAHHGLRGEIIEVSEDEAARGEALGFLADPDEEPETVENGWVPADDETIAAMNVEQIVAYLGQVPEGDHELEVDRIVEIEGRRSKPRTSVLALAADFEPDPADNVDE